VRDCAILQPDSAGSFQVQASAYQPAEQIALSSDEKTVASWVMAHGRPMGLYNDDSSNALAHAHFVLRIVTYSTAAGRALHRTLHLIPLKVGQAVVGVLRLQVLDGQHALQHEERLEEEHERPNGRKAFFWTFLDQATWLIERARLQRENLRIAVLQLTDRLRAALRSSVSHDLRTPLTAIKASASLFLQEHVAWDEETRRGFACSIVQEADRLNCLVSNLPDMSRIEEGALKPEKNWYSLATLIREVIGRLRPRLDGHAVHTHFPPDDLLLVELDYVQIGQVLTNLIENAIRYTPTQSPIDVSAHLEGGRVEISVADRGPGIAAEDVERVFDKFYRVLGDGHPTGSPAGSGLGLAICKGMVEAHGGRIWTEPREGGGWCSTLSCRLASEKGSCYE
jgi:two-component system, OmpR family, sensor histidine kinase KdpD